jgi:hypothetical protein
VIERTYRAHLVGKGHDQRQGRHIGEDNGDGVYIVRVAVAGRFRQRKLDQRQREMVGREGNPS